MSTLRVAGATSTMRKLAVSIAVGEAIHLSKYEPQRVFYIHAVKCGGCNRHAVAIRITDNTMPKPKYVMYTVTNGEVIPRGSRH